MTNTEYIILGLTLIGVAIMLNGLVGIFMVIGYRKATKARNWQTVTGRIESSEVAITMGTDEGTAQYPLVVYSYTVNGQALQNDDIVIDGNPSGWIYSAKMVKRYPAGSPVTVYYNPQNPAESALDRNLPSYVRGLWAALIFGNAILCGCGILPTLGFKFFGLGLDAVVPFLLKYISNNGS